VASVGFFSGFYVVKKNVVMIISQKLGKYDAGIHHQQTDKVWLHWYETNKRILHKTTTAGVEVSFKFLNESPHLTVDDIVYEDGYTLIIIDILETGAIVIKPADNLQLAAVCYEIGNKHLPLFYQGEELLVPFEEPLFNFLLAAGYAVKKEERKLIHPLKTTVSPHSENGTSLFNRIMKLTADKK
jgi:urease accessory protein